MSWMDSWSRPRKQQATPAPFYLLPNGGEEIPYCRSCGRVISSRKVPPSSAAVTDNRNNTLTSSHQKRQKNMKKGKGSRPNRDDDTAYPKAARSNNAQELEPSDQQQQNQEDHTMKQDQHKHEAEVKYCSSRCRMKKPKPGSNNLDKRIEDAFVRFLSSGGGGGGEPGSNNDTHQSEFGTDPTIPALKTSSKKGDARVLVPCDVVEEYIFGEERRLRGGDGEENKKTFGRKKNRASRVIQPQPPKTVQSYHDDNDEDRLSNAILGDGCPTRGEYEDEDGDDMVPSSSSSSDPLDPELLARLSIRSGTRIRPPQIISEVNGSVGGEKGWAERLAETEEMKERRVEGQRRSHEREMVRSAARRGVVFGFVVEEPRQDVNGGRPVQVRRKCEAVMSGKVVEPSFAKGNWAVRWRDD